MTAKLSKTYVVTISEKDDSEALLAYAHGSFRVVSAAVKDALAEMKDTEGEYTARVAETDGIGGGETRTVASVSGDADVVAFVTKKKIAAERKANGASDEDAGTDGE